MKRVIEDFVCENCGTKVIGDGYTDHCPNCLWGKHVDEAIPGDRASGCKALMEPIRTNYQNDSFKIFYKCLGCNHEFWVREGKGDNREKLIELSAN
jgi:DNA-directed RNA polymerase subunit RPC12/RpoP